MLTAVKGYYDGERIVMDDEERKHLANGDEVVITVLGKKNLQEPETRAEKRRRIIESNAFVMPTGRTAEEIDNYIREMRDDDRF